jgi:hypothetical protein
MADKLRYETVVATLVGLCALAVSAYTAWIQRQQVRAQVWPILEYDTGNQPNIRLTLTNKGIGPALIRHTVVTADGVPVQGWAAALQKLLGAGAPVFGQETINNRVLSAGEKIDVMVPLDPSHAPLTYDKSGPLGEQLNRARWRIGVEVCYCSTLGDCWTLHNDWKAPPTTVETRRCPAPSAITFLQ